MKSAKQTALNADLAKFNENFITFPLHISAYTNEKGEVKKSCSSLPKEWEKLTTSKPIFPVYKKDCGFVAPNGIGVLTKNISCIDVDEPLKCSILDKLKNDCKFYVATKKGFHFYFKQENELPRQSCCGIADINTNLLYFVPTYKHNETGEKYHYILCRSEGLVEMPSYAIDWCKMLISMRDNKPANEVKKKIKKGGVEKLFVNPDITYEKFDLKTMREIYNIFHIANFFNNYDTWRDVAYMGRHLNNTEEGFKLFDEFARKAPAYKDVPEKINREMFFGKGEYNENFDENGVLIKCSKLNKEVFKTTLQYLYRSRWEQDQEHFNMKYIYPDDDSNNEMFENWINSYKCLAIRSAYGTGKTYGFKKLITNYKFKRVLFITYRQSLAHNFSIELSERFGFKSYLDKETDLLGTDRLIIQLDSIKKLNGGFNFITQQDNMPKYDLIILDEIEGMLNHLSFEKIDQVVIHDYLKRLIQRATKVLALDGDLCDRSYDFLSEICEHEGYKFYTNDFKPNKKHFLFTHNPNKLYKAIEQDLKDGKKICIVSMTKTDTERFYQTYKDKYKCCLHNSVERNKDILKKANEEWAKCDLLIYSPSVESGVDFNIQSYFWKCYAILNENSTTDRALNQMLNRVRYYENSEILCLMSKNMSYNINELLYRFDELRLTKFQGLEQSNLVNILIHNDTEKINSKNYFMMSFIQRITNKGHTHKYLDDRPKDKQENNLVDPRDYEIEQILNADVITLDEYNSLIQRQQANEELTREETYKVQKMFICRVWLVQAEDITIIKGEEEKTEEEEGEEAEEGEEKDQTPEEKSRMLKHAWLDERLGKHETPKRFNRLNLKKEEIEEKIKSNPKNILMNFEWQKVLKIKNILEKIGFKLENYAITETEQKDYEKSCDDLVAFVSDKNFKTLFNCNRTLKKLNLLKIVNEVLEQYGLELEKEKISGKRGEDGKQEISYKHNLTFIEIIDEYIVLKLEKIEEEQQQEE